MHNKLSLSLRLLAVYFWSFTPTFILSLLPQRNSFFGEVFIREAQVIGYQFELLFALIFIVWGVYIWIASKQPTTHKLFIDFTIWASITHLLWMIIIAVLEPVDAVHLMRDAIVQAVPLGLVIYFRKKI